LSCLDNKFSVSPDHEQLKLTLTSAHGHRNSALQCPETYPKLKSLRRKKPAGQPDRPSLADKEHMASLQISEESKQDISLTQSRFSFPTSTVGSCYEEKSDGSVTITRGK
jgi:hypothetical protein